MNKPYLFGGSEYEFVRRELLIGMEYYYVYKNIYTGQLLWLYCGV